MKKCLQCEKEYEAKRPTSKFCSDNCRVIYHRKHKDKKETGVIGKVELKVLYDTILDLVSSQLNKKEEPIMNEPTHYFETPKRNLIRTFEQYRQLKLDCENQEDWVALSDEIGNAPNVSSKQKQLLLNYNYCKNKWNGCMFR